MDQFHKTVELVRDNPKLIGGVKLRYGQQVVQLDEEVPSDADQPPHEVGVEEVIDRHPVHKQVEHVPDFVGEAGVRKADL